MEYRVSGTGRRWYVEAFDGTSWHRVGGAWKNKASATWAMRTEARGDGTGEPALDATGEPIENSQPVQVAWLPAVLPDIERCALTLLARAQITHPAIKLWIDRMVTDGDYQTALEEYVPVDGFDVGAPISAGGFFQTDYNWPYTLIDSPEREEDIENGDAYPPIIRENRRHWIELDQAASTLAQQVLYYRRNGRQSGDVTIPVHGGGDPLVLLHTSLAANVANYLTKISHIYDARIERILIKHNIQEERI